MALCIPQDCVLFCAVPAKASTQPKDQIVLVGQLASISCFARANPSDISYSWEKDGKVLTNSSRVTVLDHVLLIDNVTLEDTGNYTCVPKNSIGTGMTATASLLVASKRGNLLCIF